MNKEKQTILLIRNAAPRDFGGAETYPVSLASVLTNQGLSPIIVTRSKKLLHYAHEHAIPTVRGWWWSHQNWSGKYALLLPSYIGWQIILTCWYVHLIKKTRATALHIQSKDDFIAATIAGRLTKRKTVWTDHMDLRYIFINISRPFKNPLGKLVFHAAKLSNHIILISDNEYRLVTGHFKHQDALKKKIVIIKNGVIDRKKDYPNNQRKNGGIFSFCLASRIITSKGIGEAIDAFTALQKLPSEANSLVPTLDIYGGGIELEYFKKRAANNKDIHFYGHQDDALKKVNDSDVFMLPSYQEGFSIALLEATMLGKAIIASDIDSNPEIIQNERTGLLVRVRDSKSLQHAMHLLLTDAHLRHSLEIAARKNFVENFNLETIAITKIIPLYTSG